MDTTIILPALLMTVFEGIALLIGLFFILYKDIKKDIFISFLFAFSGGMMLYAAFVKFYLGAIEKFQIDYTYNKALLYSGIAFFIGLLITSPIDHLLLKVHKEDARNNKKSKQIKKEKHLYALLLTSITLHNLLEGIATYFTYIDDSNIALIIVASLIAHNIPEGAIIAIIMYKNTNSKYKAIKMCLLAGLAGPVGALSAALIMPNLLSIEMIAIVKALLAGILVNTSLSELILPSSHLYSKGFDSKRAIIMGMLFMAILLIIK